MKSSIGLFYQLTVRDKNGKVVRKTRLRRSRSFCIAFLQMLQVQMLGVDKDIRDNLNSLETGTPASTNFFGAGPAGNDDWGIILGTGTTPPTNTDYVIETKIEHGSGATQINYAIQTDIDAQEVGANVDYQLIRSFQNLSGSTINVSEAGFYGYVASPAKYGLMVHDTFTTVPVLDGETLTATYIFRTTV
ncbi:hypothetical protein ES705_23012 [subsurface metagenome]